MSLLLDLAERALNACAASLGATDPSRAADLAAQGAEYAGARQATLQHALDQGIGMAAAGARAALLTLHAHCLPMMTGMDPPCTTLDIQLCFPLPE